MKKHRKEKLTYVPQERFTCIAVQKKYDEVHRFVCPVTKLRDPKKDAYRKFETLRAGEEKDKLGAELAENGGISLE